MHGLTGIFGTGLQSQTHVYDLILTASFPFSSGAFLCLVEWYHGISRWCNTISRGCWWKIKRTGEKNIRKKEVYKQKRGTRISFEMDILLACSFLSKVFGAPHTWDIHRSGCALPIFITLSWGLKSMLQPRKTCGRIIVCLPCWPPKKHGCFNSFPPLVSILRWKTPFFVETGATCIV